MPENFLKVIYKQPSPETGSPWGRDYVVQNMCNNFNLKSIVAQQSETPVVFKLYVHWNGLSQAASESKLLSRLIKLFYYNLATLWNTFLRFLGFTVPISKNVYLKLKQQTTALFPVHCM